MLNLIYNAQFVLMCHAIAQRSHKTYFSFEHTHWNNISLQIFYRKRVEIRAFDDVCAQTNKQNQTELPDLHFVEICYVLEYGRFGREEISTKYAVATTTTKRSAVLSCQGDNQSQWVLL